MAAPSSLVSPSRKNFNREMHQKKILEIPCLKQERRHVVLFPFIRSSISIIVTMIDVFVRHYVCTSVLSRLQCPADLSQVLKAAAACIVRDKHNRGPLLIQETVELLDICEFRIAFANNQVWSLHVHLLARQMYGNGMPE